jgi:two-component system sensor histidine kinase and response regulator WspE
MSAEDLRDVSMIDLFRMEADGQAQVLTSGLLALERDPTAADELEACMRAAHSLKGAARIVGLTAGVRVAHTLEDCFVAAQGGRIRLCRRDIDSLLRGVDLLVLIANSPEGVEGWTGEKHADVEACLATLGAVLERSGQLDIAAEGVVAVEGVVTGAGSREVPAAIAHEDPQAPGAASLTGEGTDRVLRVTAESLNRLLGLAGESRVKSSWVRPFSESLLRLKRLHRETAHTLDSLRDALPQREAGDEARTALADVQRRLTECERLLADRLVEIDLFDRRSVSLSHRLYDEALACRMRPFGDALQGFPRLVRDVARSLGKQVKLEIAGETTQVDRDILGKLDAPLGHLLRNAIDHGLESPDERRAAGKPEDGVLRLEARHSAGKLQILISDDGRGVDMNRLRARVTERNFLNAEAALALTEAELLEFLFLPGFTLKDRITDISGRGVGLDAVQDMVKQVRGTVRISSRPGHGTTFLLQLPVTLSVLRAVLAEIAGEPYAFPLAFITRIVKLSRTKIDVLEGRQHFELDGRRIGLISAHQVLGTSEPPPTGDELPVIVVGDADQAYGIIVDRLMDQRELVAQPLDPHLGKIKDISAGAFMEDGSPVLIVDAEDMMRSVSKLVSAGDLVSVQHAPVVAGEKSRKRVLVVDDSLTVRELERKLLGSHGYDVEVAVDGMDGWNAVRTGRFNLVVTDIDMPRMDGIELVTLINKDPNLKSLPVMIVSYKDRDEDRRRGLEAGAAYYLTKGSFHDETLVQAVVDLIGEAAA